jgi:hypothetical protein
MTDSQNPRPSTIQDYHEEQSTFEMVCSGNEEDQTAPEPGPLATAILVNTVGNRYLVANWHVVTGKHPASEKQIALYPPRLLFARENILTETGGSAYPIPLYCQGMPLWIESHRRVPVEGTSQRIDIAIIPFVCKACVQPGINLDDARTQTSVPRPLDQVSVIGFPFRRPRPIWKTAHVAESVQPYVDYFLINGRTKRGMSSSGVFSTSISLYDNLTKIQNRLLLGIYSGRYSDTESTENTRATERELNELDLGIVWKIDLIKSILNEGQRIETNFSN